jgi:hypothetical protein
MCDPHGQPNLLTAQGECTCNARHASFAAPACGCVPAIHVAMSLDTRPTPPCLDNGTQGHNQRRPCARFPQASHRCPQHYM